MFINLRVKRVMAIVRKQRIPTTENAESFIPPQAVAW
jgi:hypothetical protein